METQGAGQQVEPDWRLCGNGRKAIMVKLTQPIYPVKRENDVPAPMRDGIVLRADLYRPQGVGPFPVIVMRTPYGKRRQSQAEDGEALAARGYIVVIQDIRGRYASEGEFDPFYSPTCGETCTADGYDTVEWAAALSDSSGAVGTAGVSYMAWTQWKLGAARPPHLKAMFVGGMAADSRTTWPGIFARDRQLQWSLCSLVPDTRQRLGLPGPKTVEAARTLWNEVDRSKWLWFTPMADFPASILGGLAEHWRYWLAHHHCDWFRLAGKCGEVDVPIFHVTSWYDRLWGTVDLYAGMVQKGRTEKTRQSQKLLLGPWSHGFGFPRTLGVVDFGPEAELVLADVMARWFDYWLKGIASGIMEEPPVRLFIMGENKWREEHEWPLARAVHTDYYFHSGGRANTPFGDGVLSPEPAAMEQPDSYLYDPRDPVMSLHQPDGHAAPGDVRAHDDRQDILVYQTPPLAQEVEVTGPLEVKLYAASSAPDTDWTVRLVDVHPGGLAVNLSYGIARARYRDSWDNPSLLKPGQVYE